MTDIHPFTALINGAPGATSVVYDNETNEGSVAAITAGAGYWGRMMLYNSTRGTYRKIVSVNIITNTITTENSVDAWADNDSITTQSQTNTTAGYVDIDLSAEVDASVYAVWIGAQINEQGGIANLGHGLFLHPFKAYDAGLRCYIPAALANEVSITVYPLEVISQKITIFTRSVTQSLIILLCKGVLK